MRGIRLGLFSVWSCSKTLPTCNNNNRKGARNNDSLKGKKISFDAQISKFVKCSKSLSIVSSCDGMFGDLNWHLLNR